MSNVIQQVSGIKKLVILTGLALATTTAAIAHYRSQIQCDGSYEQRFIIQTHVLDQATGSRNTIERCASAWDVKNIMRALGR